MEMTLYKIANNYLSALNELSQDENLSQEAIEAALARIQCEFEEKAMNVATYVKQLDFMAGNIKEAIREMSRRQARLENLANKLTRYLKTEMDRVGIKSIETVYASLNIKNNPPRVVVDDEDEVPVDYKDYQAIIRIDKNKIKEALNSGKEVPGVHLEQWQRLEIR